MATKENSTDIPKPWQISLAIALIGSDPIGPYLKGGDIQEAAKSITAMAIKSGISLQEFWQLLIIYFQVDAGSYTKDAGGYPSLDHLFCFNPAKGEMSFSPAVNEKIEKLKEEILAA